MVVNADKPLDRSGAANSPNTPATTVQAVLYLILRWALVGEDVVNS